MCIRKICIRHYYLCRKVAHNICGYHWILYENTQSINKEWSLMVNVTELHTLKNCDLNEFLQFLQKEYGDALPTYLISIQFGQDIVEGSGYTNMTLFELNVGGSSNLCSTNDNTGSWFMAHKVILLIVTGSFIVLLGSCLIALCVFRKKKRDDIAINDASMGYQKVEGHVADTYESLTASTQRINSCDDQE